METSKKGYREDLKQFFRSKMEANVARYYQYQRINWQYEGLEYEFKSIKRGTRYYKPDFYLEDKDNIVEVKGWFRRTDKIKLKRFKKYYPKEFEKLVFIIPNKWGRDRKTGEMVAFIVDVLGKDFFQEIESYKEMEVYGSMIPGWE